MVRKYAVKYDDIARNVDVHSPFYHRGVVINDALYNYNDANSDAYHMPPPDGFNKPRFAELRRPGFARLVELGDMATNSDGEGECGKFSNNIYVTWQAIKSLRSELGFYDEVGSGQELLDHMVQHLPDWRHLPCRRDSAPGWVLKYATLYYN